MEIWKPVVGHSVYEVSNMGRVRSLDRIVTYKDGRQYFYKGRLLTPSIRGPYLSIKLGFNVNSQRVHTLVLTAFVGPQLEGMECCHGLGGPLDNRLENLRWGTRSSNSLEAYMFSVWSAARVAHIKKLTKTGCANLALVNARRAK